MDIPDDEPYKLEPLPGRILLLPQSYYALDVRDKHRFQSLVPPLPLSNADILVPKFHTFLEGLVHFIMNPPQGAGVPERHYNGRLKHDIFIGYLCDVVSASLVRIMGGKEGFDVVVTALQVV